MTQEALKLALEALDSINSPLHVREIYKVGWAMKAIKEALAQPEQEHFALKHRIAELEGAVIGLQAQLAQSEQKDEKGRTMTYWGGMAQPEQETPKGWKSEIWKSVKQQEQEPVTWGVDWGKAGDIPCVSIIKRLPDGGIKVMAVEYAPYSYTTPPQQEPVRIMGFNCKCGRRMEVSAEQGVVPAPQRTWVGLTDEERKNIMIECESTGDWAWELKAAQAIEAKLKEKNT